LLLLFGFLNSLSYFFYKIARVRKLAVDAGESDVGNLVNVSEISHDAFTDESRRHFLVEFPENIFFNLVGD